MLSKKEQDIIKQCAIKYNVSSVFLFGSSLEKNSKSNDIDLAVKGIDPRIFFSFYGELFKYLSKPVDLVDLDEADSYLVKRILEEGRAIYGS